MLHGMSRFLSTLFVAGLLVSMGGAAVAAPKPAAKAAKGKKGDKPLQEELDQAGEKKPAEAAATDAKPAETKPAADAKPSGTKPAADAAPAPDAAAKPAEAKPAETKPAEAKTESDLQVPRDRKSKLIPALRIAVYDLELQDVPNSVGVIVTDSLLAEVRKLQGVSAIGMNEIRDMLSHEATKQLAGCSENADSCLADLAGALGVDELVTGKLATAGSERLILVRRIDQKRAEVAGTFNQRLKAGSGQEFLATVGPAVEDLFKNYELRSGQTRGVSKEVALRLDPPPIPKGATIAVGAVAVATAITAGIVGLLAINTAQTFRVRADGAKIGTDGVVPTAVPGSELNSLKALAEQRALATNVLWGSAGGVALVGVIMALFTDWKGYRDSLRTREN